MGNLIPSVHQTGISPKLAGSSKQPASAHLKGWRFGEASASPLAFRLRQGYGGQAGERRRMMGHRGRTAPWVAALLLLAVGGAAAQEPAAEDERIRTLIRGLAADFLEDREKAREALEKAGASAEPFLLEALKSPDYRVRKASLDLLARLKSEKARELAAVLFTADEDLSVRDAAFEFMKVLGKDAEDHLIAALRSDRRRYRIEAVKALTGLKSRKCAGPMAELFEREKDAGIKDAAFACMQALGEPARPFLLKHLASREPKVRRACLEGLRTSKAPEILEAIGKLFAAESDGNAIQMAFAYLKEAGAKAEPHFMEGLKSVQEEVRLRSITGLRELKSEGAIEPVSMLFRKDRSATIRKSAAGFLESFGLQAEAPLIEALESRNPEVRLMAIESLGKIKSEKPLKHIGRLFREDKDKKVHEKSFDYLKRVGKPAEEYLLAALEDPDKVIRREAILSLGDAGSEAAIPALLDFMTQLDPSLRAAARDALVRIGLKAVEAVNEAAAKGRLKKSDAEEVWALFYQEEVERLLDNLVTDRGGTGTYAGQFRSLKEFGARKALPVLLKIARDSMPVFRVQGTRQRPRHYERKMREMAITALGALGEKEAAGPLKDVLTTLPRELALDRGDTVQDELVLALYRLGEREPLDRYLKGIQSNAEKALKEKKTAEGCGELFYVGLILNRVEQRDKSKEAYLRILKAMEEHKLTAEQVTVLPSTYYNLACLSSLKGQSGEAVSWLEKAVKSGFKDRQWIRMDRDLDGIRGEEGYKKLLADDSLFEESP